MGTGMNDLFPIYTAHCFFSSCPHVERGLDPAAVHDAVERHYQAEHARQIQHLLDTEALQPGSARG